MSGPYQEDLPFFGNGESGLARWREEQAQYVRELEQRLGVPLLTRVRIQLRDFEHEFEGVLELVAGTEARPRLRIRGERFEFGLDEMEQCRRA